MKSNQSSLKHVLGSLALLAGLASTQAAEVRTPCFLKMSVYEDIPGILATDVEADPSYPNNPSQVHYITSMDTREVFPTNTLDNYGARIEGWITPQESGDYEFFLRSDDGGELWLSPDDSESNLRLICEELDCCDPFMEPDTGDLATSLPVKLEAGESYYIMLLYKEGGGGDFAQAAWRKVGDTTPAGMLTPISGSYLSTNADNSHNPEIILTGQPVNASGEENGSVNFSVDFTATPDDPVCVQWQKNGVNIPGGTGASYTIDLLTSADNNAKISAVIAVPGLFVESEEVTLSVTPDTTVPTLVSAKGIPNEPQVKLTFSERISIASATNRSNYQITHAGGTLDVLEISMSAAGDVITLTTEEQTIGTEYTLVLNGLQDRASTPNRLAADTSVSFNAVGHFLQNAQGFVVWEAEAYDRNLDGLWVEDFESNATRGEPSGGVGMLIPNGAGGNESNTKLEYDIVFTRTGTHILWYRASADSGNDDSMWFHLDGDRPSTRVDGNQASMSGFNGNPYEWNSNPQDGSPPMTFEIDEVGMHTISVARREDGAFVDKFIITVDPNFDPEDFGPFGPDSTLREGEKAEGGATATITLNPVDTEGIENTSITLSAAAEVTEGVLTTYQWQRQENGDWVDIDGQTLPDLTIDPLTMDWNGAVVRYSVTTVGDAVISTEATITVIAETEAPSIVTVSGIATTRKVAVLFSEPITAASAEDAGNYSIAPGNVAVNSATLLPNKRMVLLDTGNMSAGTKYTVTANGIADTAATPNRSDNAQAKFYSLGDLLPQGDDGLLVFEAESFTDNLDDLWIEDSERGTPSGGVSMVNPNGAGGSEGATQLLYDLEFTQTGTHIIWYRASSEGGTDDSAWLYLDGERPTNRTDGNQASMSGFSAQADFIWLSDPQDGPSPMTFEIDNTGVHTIGLARREDGAFFDKFVITTDPDFNPADFGPMGPPETRRGAPPLPTITLQDPAPEARYDEGADVAFIVDIINTSRTIEKVTYTANDEIIAEVTASPYNFTWENAPTGVYIVQATLMDDVGAQVGTSAIPIVVGQPNEILFLVADPTLTTNPGDAAAADHLRSLGFIVDVTDDNGSQTLDAFGKKLVVVSSTVNSGNIGGKYAGVEVPVLTWEEANQDDFRMTTDEAGFSRGNTEPLTELEIVNGTHPITSGFQNGPLTVFNTADSMAWGYPEGEATILATVPGDLDQAVLYAYDTGDEMLGGFVAPARRVSAFLSDGAFLALNDDGMKLFNAALAWALDETLQNGGGGNVSDLYISITAQDGAQVTIAWEGGTGPYTVQTKASLSDAQWTNHTTTDSTSATISIESGNAFFRVVAGAP